MKRGIATGKSQRSRDCQGIALLLTLGILLLLTLLALSFSSSQLTENQAAKNFYYTAKAEEIALGGLETAIGVLREDARDNSCDHLRERWAIYYPENDGVAGNDSEDADLSDYDELEYGVDEGHNFLDLSARRDPWKDKDPKPDSRWIKVVSVDPLTRKERVVGRYAVCIEDENAKANINTAGNPKPQTLSWEHRQNMGLTTAEVDLGAIFEHLGDLFSAVFPDLGKYPDNVSSETALDVVAFRYGWRSSGLGDSLPGGEGDDNSTDKMPPFLRQNTNGLDDDGDRLIDEPGEEDDEPGEFDPYEPMEMRAPGHLSVAQAPRPGETGVMGNDTPYLTVSHIKMAQSISHGVPSIADKKSEPPYPEDRLYRSLLPYITVYSHDLNRFSSNDVTVSKMETGVTWMKRENIARWLGSPSQIEKFLKHIGLPYLGGQTPSRALRQIAVNIYDFIDPDWFPTPYKDVVGIEPTAYLNELEAAPPAVPGTVAGLSAEVVIEDYGEYIELWNPYDVAVDVANYYVTIDESGQTQRIGSMAVVSTVIPPRAFFIIGDTLGEVKGPEGVEHRTLRPYPPGCQAYGPINLDPPFVDIFLEIDVPGRGRILAETHYPVPFAPPEHHTLQKDDPRVPWDWDHGPPTPGSMNSTVINREDVYSSFYAPGIRSWARDASYNPSNSDLLDHAGALASLGELGMVHRADKWQTLNFTGKVQYGYAEDVRLLDLLTLPYQYRCSGATSLRDPLPAREYVPGRININTAPPEVLLGLNWEPMIKELKSYYGLRVSPALRYAIIRHIIQRRTEWPYRNIGEVAVDIGHFMDKYHALEKAPEAAREAFIRHNANLITTKSNVFKITVLAEVFDRRGNVAATRKLEAVVDRGYTPGTFKRPGEDTPTALEQARAETARTLYFRWITEN